MSFRKEDILLYTSSFVVILNESSTAKPDYLSYAKPVFRIWIGSGFNWVSGSGSGLGFWIRIQAGQNCPKENDTIKKFYV
jgi:hypothetical protein